MLWFYTVFCCMISEHDHLICCYVFKFTTRHHIIFFHHCKFKHLYIHKKSFTSLAFPIFLILLTSLILLALLSVIGDCCRYNRYDLWLARWEILLYSISFKSVLKLLCWLSFSLQELIYPTQLYYSSFSLLPFFINLLILFFVLRYLHFSFSHLKFFFIFFVFFLFVLYEYFSFTRLSSFLFSNNYPSFLLICTITLYLLISFCPSY